MGAWTGDYGRNMFPASRRKQYIKTQQQQGKPPATPDGNDEINLGFEGLRNFIESYGGPALFKEDAFKVVGASLVDSFNVELGSAWLRGIEAYLAATVEYASDGDTIEKKNLHSVSTGLSATLLTDSALKWTVNELVGRSLVPNIEDGAAFPITANTATTITVTGDMTAVAGVGNVYFVKLSAPSGSDRTDTVWVNMYLDEIDAVEDPDLLHSLGSGLEVDRRIKARTIIMVEQGNETYTDYTDGDGNSHYLQKIGVIERYDSTTTIFPVDVADQRFTQLGMSGESVVQWHSARTFHLASTGNDTTGDGTLGNPWHHPNRVLQEISGQVQREEDIVIQFAPGTYQYTENCLIYGYNTGTIVFKGALASAETPSVILEFDTNGWPSSSVGERCTQTYMIMARRSRVHFEHIHITLKTGIAHDSETTSLHIGEASRCCFKGLKVTNSHAQGILVNQSQFVGLWEQSDNYCIIENSEIYGVQVQHNGVFSMSGGTLFRVDGSVVGVIVGHQSYFYVNADLAEIHNCTNTAVHVRDSSNVFWNCGKVEITTSALGFYVSDCSYLLLDFLTIAHNPAILGDLLNINVTGSAIYTTLASTTLIQLPGPGGSGNEAALLVAGTYGLFSGFSSAVYVDNGLRTTGATHGVYCTMSSTVSLQASVLLTSCGVGALCNMNSSLFIQGSTVSSNTTGLKATEKGIISTSTTTVSGNGTNYNPVLGVAGNNDALIV